MSLNKKKKNGKSSWGSIDAKATGVRSKTVTVPAFEGMHFRVIQSPRRKDSYLMIKYDEVIDPVTKKLKTIPVDAYGFPKKRLKEDPIDTLTHEFSEGTIADVIDKQLGSKKNKGPAHSRIKLFAGSTHTAPHHMVSHHTKSGKIVGDDFKVKIVSPEEYMEEFYGKENIDRLRQSRERRLSKKRKLRN